MSEKIEILVTLDEHYLNPLKVMLTSLRINNPHPAFRVWLVHKGISSNAINELQLLMDNLTLELAELKVADTLFEEAPIQDRYPREMYFRLLCGEILPKELTKIIYLDPDLLIINPITPLWSIDLEDNMIAAAAHAGLTNISKGINNIRLGTTHEYYNSGVMLIDLDKMRAIVKLTDIYEAIKKYDQLLFLPDQDLLNHLYGEQIKEIPEEIWNYDTRQGTTYYTRSKGLHDGQWVANQTAILHFCGKPKPWESSRNDRFTFLYFHYQKLMERASETK